MTFAGLPDFLRDADFSQLQEYKPIPQKNGWRVETREYIQKDGTVMIYYNYRSRKSHINENGKRTTKYKKGGKHVKTGQRNNKTRRIDDTAGHPASFAGSGV